MELIKCIFINPEIIETSFIPKGEVFKKDSHAVVLNTVFNEVKYIENSNNLVFSSEGVTVKINKNLLKSLIFIRIKKLLQKKEVITNRYTSH